MTETDIEGAMVGILFRKHKRGDVIQKQSGMKNMKEEILSALL